MTVGPSISLHSNGSSEPWEREFQGSGDVYKHLLRLNRGFDAVRRSLLALRHCEAFDRGELKRMGDRAEETRASTNSYLTAALESSETDRAGRLYRKRISQERKDEQPGKESPMAD